MAGRPPKGDKAMTAAERARAYRARRPARQTLAMRKPEAATLNALLAELRENVKLGNTRDVKRICAELTQRATREP